MRVIWWTSLQFVVHVRNDVYSWLNHWVRYLFLEQRAMKTCVTHDLKRSIYSINSKTLLSFALQCLTAIIDGRWVANGAPQPKSIYLKLSFHFWEAAWPFRSLPCQSVSGWIVVFLLVFSSTSTTFVNAAFEFQLKKTPEGLVIFCKARDTHTHKHMLPLYHHPTLGDEAWPLTPPLCRIFIMLQTQVPKS